MSENKSETSFTAKVEDRLSAQQVANVRASINGTPKAKKAKANPAEAAIDESAGEDMAEQVNAIISDFAMAADKRFEAAEREVAAMRMAVGECLAGLGTLGEKKADRAELARVEDRVKAIEAKPASTFLGELETLLKLEGEAKKKALAAVDNTVREADSARLVWGIRHVNRARNSTIGRTLETAALMALAGFGVYQGGASGYRWIRG